MILRSTALLARSLALRRHTQSSGFVVRFLSSEAMAKMDTTARLSRLRSLMKERNVQVYSSFSATRPPASALHANQRVETLQSSHQKTVTLQSLLRLATRDVSLSQALRVQLDALSLPWRLQLSQPMAAILTRQKLSSMETGRF